MCKDLQWEGANQQAGCPLRGPAAVRPGTPGCALGHALGQPPGLHLGEAALCSNTVY